LNSALKLLAWVPIYGDDAPVLVIRESVDAPIL